MKKNYFKKIFVNALVFSLLQSQTINMAYAVDPNDVGTAINLIGGIGQNILSQKSQLQQQQMAMIQAQNIQKQLQPKLTPSKYFPECQMPAAMAAVPTNVCQQTNNPTQLQSMYAYETAAQNMMNYFDQMTNEVTKVPNVGIQCLTNQQKNLDSQLVEMINNLTRLQTQLKEESQKFREANKGLISDLEETNTELMGENDGGSAKNSVNSKARDFSKMVSPDCQKVVGEQFGNASGLGFNGLLKNVAPKNLAANDYQRSRVQIESELKAAAQKMKDSINENGLDNWAAQDNNGFGRGQMDLADKLSSYPSLTTIMQRERSNLLAQTTRIAKELKKLNYDIPAADKNISSNLASSISSVQGDLRSKYVSDCTISSQKGVAIDFEKILGSVEQKGTENSPMAISGYKTALTNIINSDDDLESKLKNIKQLEKDYPKMTISYTDFNGGTVTETAFNVLNKTKTNCENKFESVGAGDAKSVQKLLQEYKNLTDSFPGKLNNSIVNTVINCNGESLKATDKCDADSINPAKQQNFCMAKATSCANNMLSCYNEINTAVETRKVKMNNIAKTFNQNVSNMVERANALYKAQAANVVSLTKMVQQRFPGTNFEIPTDMFISLPETSKDKYGLDLAANGDINKIIAELPSKVDKLKEIFANQRTEADREINAYISAQTKNISAEKAKFNKLYSECKSAADSSAQAIAAANAAGQKRQDEIDANLASFCSKYTDLSADPMAGCGDASTLYTDAQKVAAYLDPKVKPTVLKYKGLCASFNNNSEASYFADLNCNTDVQDDEKAACKKAKLAARRSSGAASGSGKKAKPSIELKLSKLCNKGDKTSDEDFIKNTENKLGLKLNDSQRTSITNGKAEKSREVLGKDSNLAFFSGLFGDESISFGDGTDNICKSLTDAANKKPEQSSTQKGELDKLTAAVTAANNLTEKDEKEKAAKATALKTAQDALEAKNKEIASSSSSDAAKKEFDKKLTEIALASDPAADSSSDGISLSSIGEQLANTPCVANSNKNLPKNPLDYDVKAYDNKKLGGLSQ